MAHQIVATSVPRGLDGVSGYQTVLKSEGIPPRVFDRLKARSGYSHRYPHGDSRNPVVYVHRIEELGGTRWHVLGCIRDAGSDHTGRSNFLAHMLGVDAAEARGKPGGPAAAALARGCFLEKWEGPPEPAAGAKPLVVADRPPRAGDAPAWVAAGLDPGLAGDLANAAMLNGKIVLVTRPSDDVLSLFADALRLVEPSKRWSVTFNTCAIEDFDGTWKAIRADFAVPKDLRDGKIALIDLTTNPRSSADPYAQFARGETGSLPWQRVAEREPDDEAKDTAPHKAKTPDDKAATTARKKHMTSRMAAARNDTRRERRPRYQEEDPAGTPWHVIAIAGISLLVVAAVAAIPFREKLMSLVQPEKQRPVVPLRELEAEPIKPPAIDGKTNQWEMAKQVNKVKDRLVAGVEGFTHSKLLESATQLSNQLEVLQQDFQMDWSEAISAAARTSDSVLSTEEEINTVIKTCKDVADFLKQGSEEKLKNVQELETNFNGAVAKLVSLEGWVSGLENDLKKRQESRKKAAVKAEREKQAFKDFQAIARAVTLPTAAIASGIDFPESGSAASSRGEPVLIDLGAFAAADLVQPIFRIAVPRDTIANSEFKLVIVKDDGPGDPEWVIQYLSKTLGMDGKVEPPRPLAALVVRHDNLLLKVLRPAELYHQPFALFRRSVILAEAKDPAAPKARPVEREIRLVEPTKVPPLVIDLFAKKKQPLKIFPPAGIPRGVTEGGVTATFALPVSSLRLEADFPDGVHTSIELPKDATERSKPGIINWTILLAQLGPDLRIVGDLELSLPGATMALETRLVGEKAALFQKEDIEDFFIHNPEKALNKFEERFKRVVKTGKDFTVSQNTNPKEAKPIHGWFEQNLVPQGMGVPAQIIQDSFEMFLKEQYDEANPDLQSTLPKNFDDFEKRCREVKDEARWQQFFTNRISDWENWFWQKFKDQWDANVKLFQGTVGERYEIRITAITSLAYDDAGTVYEVPLVVSTLQGGQNPDQEREQDRRLGAERDGGPRPDVSPAYPTQSTGGSGSVGLD